MMKQMNFSPIRKPEHRSSAWIAHNAAMQAKRGLLTGQRPVIGSAYTPKVQVEPAVYVPARRPRVSFKRMFYDVMCLVGCVTTLGAMFFIGAAVGF